MYATEIDAEMLAKIRDAAAAANLINVMVITAGERSTNLPDACCDAIYMRRVYHHLSDSADTVQGVHRALRPGGRFAVVDFLSPWWLFFIHHGVSADAVVPQVTAAGFAVERRIDRWSLVDYCIVFRKTE